MSPLTLNRIVMILAIIGVFIAGVLSYQHVAQLSIPCGASKGCETVARHPSSNWFGLPVAFYGFAGYVALFGLAVVRGAAGLTTNRLFVGAGYAISAIGMITSLYLQYVSFVVIQAKCIWCISSAVTMVATFGVYSYYFNKIITASDSDETFRKPRMSELGAGLAGLVVSLGAVYGVMMKQESVNIIFKELADESVARLVPDDRNQLGPDDAAVTLVEFADLCCPTCRRSFPKLKEMVTKYNGKLRAIYRHMPIDHLQGHEMALVAATTAEFAAESGKFWEFASAFTSSGDVAPTTREGVMSIASSVGLDMKALDKALGDSESKAANRMVRDLVDATETFKVEYTPTYILYVKGQKPISVNYTGLMKALESENIKKALN